MNRLQLSIGAIPGGLSTGAAPAAKSRNASRGYAKRCMHPISSSASPEAKTRLRARHHASSFTAAPSFTAASPLRPAPTRMVRTSSQAAEVLETTAGPADGVKDVVVVGAGPAGSAAAMLLSQKGYRVKVFERRGDPALEDASASRAFGIVINQRGKHALEQLGIQLPAPGCGVKFEGSLRHTSKGKSVSPNSDGVVCVDRAALARHMVQHARENFSDIEFHFDVKCTGLDTESKSVCFEGDDGAQISTGFDLLVGADGANSVVRETLASQGKITFTRSENERDYKSFVLSKDLWDETPEYENKMLTWASVDGSVTRMWAVPNPDGTGQGMLTLQKGAFEGMDSSADYAGLLSSKFAGIQPSMLEAISESCSKAPVSGGGTMVKCSSLHSGNVVLVGDAGHSMYPALGQGCNSAIESASALVELLDQNGGANLEQALSAYTDLRLPEVSAAADLSAKVIEIDGSSGPIGAYKKAIFGLQIVSALILSKLAPSFFSPPVLFQVNKVGQSYVKLKNRSTREAVLLSAVILALAAGLSAVICSLLSGIRAMAFGA